MAGRRASLGQVMLARLAVRFRLPPLALKDTLRFGNGQRKSSKWRARVDRYGPGELLVCMPFIQIHRKMEQDGPVRVSVASLCVHVLQPQHTVLILQLNPSAGSGKELGTQLSKAIAYPHTALREQGIEFLVHKLLDEALDEISPVLELYRARLGWLQRELRRCRRSPNQFEQQLDEVALMRAELADMGRLVRPIKSMINALDNELGAPSRVSYDGTDSGTGPNWSMLEGHTEQLLEDMQALSETVAALTDEFNNIMDKRTNDILYVLTMVTTAIVPLQTLSGIYGMNFVNPDGTPAMPELLWKGGYAFFWGLSILLSLLILMVFRMKGWL